MAGAHQPPPSRPRGREGALAVALATFAALRIGVFAAAFPFFSNVDEHRHVDMVLKYGRGYMPAPGADGYESEMPMLLGIYGSPEYHMPLEAAEEPVRWERSSEKKRNSIRYNERFLEGRSNLEAFGPPLYYAAAGLWLRVGRALDLERGPLLYWVRALNALVYFVLVLGSYWFLRTWYPQDGFMRLGVPVLLSVFPQDALYYVTRDALSPAMGAAGLFGAVAIVRAKTARPELYALVGIVGAAAFLSKYSNAPVVGLYGLATLAALLRRDADRPLLKLLLLWALVLIPIGIWLARNQLLFGELLATGGKVDRLGWSRKGIGEYWSHPIFTLGGASIFVRELITTFWRGELAWYRQTLVSAGADWFYTVSSLLLFALATVGLWVRRRRGEGVLVEALSLACVASAVALLACLSLMFVFGETTNPTADNPYLSQGRLIACALVPFALLYVRGIQVAASPLPEVWRLPACWALLAVVVCVVGVSEWSLSRPVFESEYNWFHQLGRGPNP
jgi:hypothetical protein